MNCPYLGLKSDPQTHMTFPSVRNCCQCIHPAVLVRPEYQSLYCLTPSYAICPVYRSKGDGPLPRELRAFPPPASSRNLLIAICGSLIFVLLLSLFLWQSGLLSGLAGPAETPFGSPRTAPTDAPLTPPAAIDTISQPIDPPPGSQPTALPIWTAAETLTPIPSETLVVETATATPIDSQLTVPPPEATDVGSSPSPTAAVCRPPAGWMLYTVQVGDSLYQISLLFNTTVARLQEANCMGSSTLIVTGQKLYVPATPTATIDSLRTALPTSTPTPPPTDTGFITPTLMGTPTTMPAVRCEPNLPTETATNTPTQEPQMVNPDTATPEAILTLP